MMRLGLALRTYINSRTYTYSCAYCHEWTMFGLVIKSKNVYVVNNHAEQQQQVYTQNDIPLGSFFPDNLFKLGPIQYLG